MSELSTHENANLTAEANLAAAMKLCESDRDQLKLQMERMLQELWTEELSIIQEIFSQSPGLSKEPRLFHAYRSRVLNKGNQLKRSLPSILDDYLVQQVYTRETVVKTVAKTNGPSDPWNLPVGVKVRPY